MRIHRLKLTDFRGVAEREVHFAPDGVTIVEGPNEAGKTSLAEAIDLVLSTKDNSSARAVKAAQPVNRDVGPRVEIEISTGAYHFTYTKQWLKQRSTTLHIQQPRPEQLTGVEAHERVEAILEETVDAQLWAALRLAQGEELAQAAFDTPALTRALDDTAGGETTSTRDDTLLHRIEQEWAEYWTAGGKPKAPRTALSAEVAEAADEVHRLRAELDELASQTQQVEILTRSLEGLSAQREECAEERSSAAAALQAVEQSRQELATLEEQCEGAALRFANAESELARRAELVDDRARVSDELIELKLQRQDQISALETAQEQLDKAKLRRTELEEQHASAKAQLEVTRRWKEYLQDQSELHNWRQRQARVIEAQAAISAAFDAVQTHQLDAGSLEELEQQALEVERAKAQLEVAGAQVTAEVHQPVELAVNGVPQAVNDGSLSWVASEPWQLEVNKLVTIRVEPGQGTRVLAESVKDAEDRFVQLCRRLDVASVQEARERLAARHRAEQEGAEARSVLSRELQDLTPELLVEQVSILEGRVANHEAALGVENTSELETTGGAGGVAPAGGDVHRAYDRAEEELNEITVLLSDGQGDFDHAEQVLNGRRVDERVLSARIEDSEAVLAQATERLTQARAQLSDEALQTQLTTTQAHWEKLESQQAEAVAALDALNPDTIELRHTNAVAALTRVEESLTTQNDQRKYLVTVLEVQGERGLASELDGALTTHQHLERRHQALEARAQAAKLLYDTMSARRQQARQRYMAPFRNEIERLSRIVFGPDVEIELDEELRIARRVLDGVALDFDQLSVGAREQLGLLARLACASLVSADGGAPVIFDDVLGYTDPERLRTMGAAIAAASQGCQVIILTCTPGRYSYVGQARVEALS